MVNRGNTKLKLLYLLEILKEESDEHHILSMSDLIGKLEERGIPAERKAVAGDIKALCEAGYDICLYEENRKGYYLRTREFEPHEVRLLIDAVSSARFITRKKTEELVKKLKKLNSLSQARLLHNQLYVIDRIKCHNECIYYNIDSINRAIVQNRKIKFFYYSFNLDKESVAQREGRPYLLSPYALAWHGDNYYLIGNKDNYNNLSHYRLDRMRGVQVLEEEPRKSFQEITEYQGGFNTADYVKKTFSMFPGEQARVELKFKNELVNVALDRFGTGVSLFRVDGEHFKIVTDVFIGTGFISWVMQVGPGVEILSPRGLRRAIWQRLQEMQKIY